VSEPEIWAFEPNGWVPNSELPVLVWRNVVPVGDPDAIEARLCQNGWRPDWRDGVYPYHHYHSTAHEALACTSGSAELMLGGEGGRQVHVAAGDLLVLPAGTGHCRIKASGDFLLVGAYPQDQDWDICREAPDEAALARIAAVPLPRADPVEGAGGALMRHWGARP
jgi:uncharacterized protein YjlB